MGGLQGGVRQSRTPINDLDLERVRDLDLPASLRADQHTKHARRGLLRLVAASPREVVRHVDDHERVERERERALRLLLVSHGQAVHRVARPDRQDDRRQPQYTEGV